MHGSVWTYEDYVPVLHPTVYLAPGVQIVGRVTLGEDVNVWHNTVIRGDVERIEIGARTNVQDLTMIHVTTDRYGTYVEHDVTIGHKVMLHGCKVGHHCLIGMSAIVMDDVEIGPYSIIGAGALLTPGTKIPEGSLAVGSPARVKRQVTDAERAYLELSALHYVDVARIHMATVKRVN